MYKLCFSGITIASIVLALLVPFGIMPATFPTVSALTPPLSASAAPAVRVPIRSAADGSVTSTRGTEPTTYTDDAGHYRFKHLPRGTHKVTLDPTTLPIFLRPAAGEAVPTLWVVPGQELTSDALAPGVRLTAAYDQESGDISGVVFLDRDGDGLQGPGEVGLAGVRVIDPNVHQYFVPFDDRDLIAMFRASNTCQGVQGTTPVGNFLTSGVSIAASSNGTVWYYDHWEDGYDADPLHPAPNSSTLSGTLNAGQTRLFSNDIDTRLVGSGTPLYFDGRDRITIVGERAMVMRYAYPSLVDSTIGSRFAGAWDIEETAGWDTAFIIPAGEDYGSQSDFEFTSGSFMAMQNNTQVYLNGVLTATLNMGQTFFMNGVGNGAPRGGLNSGDLFTATAPIMGSLYASICNLGTANVPWSGDGYTLEPVAHWRSEYWSPVSSRVGRAGCNTADTDIFVYNDNPVTVTVTVDDGSPANIALPPRSSSSVRGLLGRSFSNINGVHLYSPGGERFWGVVNFDTRGTAYEWGFALVHDPTSRVLLAWAPGNALVPPSAQTPNPNGNLAWVTALTDTVVFVDLNGDGVPDQVDCNGNGTATDLGVDGICNEPTSNLGITLPRGRTLRIGHPVGGPNGADLTGALIYTRNYAEKITVAWGEDSCVAAPGLPYLDLGYIVLPLTSHTLAITKTAQPSPVPAGGVLTYTLAWSVSGNVPAPGVTISDTVPANTTLITATLPVTVNGTLLTWPLGDRVPGESGFVTFTVQVASPLLSGTLILNSVLISDSTGITDTKTITTPVISSHALAITKTGSPSPVAPGNLLAYTLAWNVSGNEPAPDVTISDTVPQSTTFQSCGPSGCFLSGGTVIWPLGTFNPPASGVATMTVQVDSSVLSGTAILNTVLITDSQGITDTKTITTPVQQSGDVAVTKSDDPDPVIPGTMLTYTLVVTNNGPITATGVVVTDTLPPEVTFVSAVPTPASPAGANPITWSLGTLLPLEVRQLTVTTQVQPWVRQTFTNTVVVGSQTPDNNPSNNRDDEPTTPLIPSLVLVKSVTPAQAVRYQPFTYTLRITNTGQITFNPLVLTDTLPPNFSYLVGSGVPSDPNVIAEPLLRWNNLGPLVPGAGITVSFAVSAATGITGVYTNTALVAGTTPAGVLTDTSQVPVVLHDPEVAIQKLTVAADVVAPKHITFTIAITNVGTSVIDVLPLVDQYDPYYLSFVGAVPAPNEPANDGSLAWYDLTAPPPHGFNRNLPPGAAFVITTVFTVAHDIIVTYNTALINGGTDIYNNPINHPSDRVPIVDIPTAIGLLYFRVDGVSGRDVRLGWATAVEIDNMGFNLYRADANDLDRARLIHFEPAVPHGRQLGATYAYVDTVPSDGVWWYWLADVDTNGRETFYNYNPIRGSVGIDAILPNRIYLPFVIKSP